MAPDGGNGLARPAGRARRGGLWRATLVISFVLLPPLVAGAAVAQKPKRYEASAVVFPVTAGVVGAFTGPGSPSEDPQRLLETDSRLARQNAVARAAGAEAVPAMPPEKFLRSSSVASDPTANVLTFSVRSGLPAQAVRLATAYALAFISYRARFETIIRSKSAAAPTTKYVLAGGPARATQVAPRPVRAALVALLAGIACAAAMFLAVGAIDRKAEA